MAQEKRKNRTAIAPATDFVQNRGKLEEITQAEVKPAAEQQPSKWSSSERKPARSNEARSRAETEVAMDIPGDGVAQFCVLVVLNGFTEI